VFDVSHLGTVRIGGPDAFELLQRTQTNDLAKIAPGRAQYTHLLDEADGSVLDDIIVWWHPESDPGEPVFDVMTNGWGKMNSYADKLTVADRWAVAAYIRALQASQNPEQIMKTNSNAPAGNTAAPPQNAESHGGAR
jgi:hypothetical protein